MTFLLASVTSAVEAHMALDAGADIIDLKNPSQGALGALPVETIKAVVQEMAGKRLTSATIGDLPMQPELVVQTSSAVAATGVDIVKVGMFGHDGHLPCIQALAALACQHKMVAVLFADEAPNFALLPALAAAGFHGVMLDTAHKTGKRLTDFLAVDALRQFVQQAKSLNLFSGLAGSLRVEDIPLLAPLAADYLGFRGALCENSNRTNTLNHSRITHLTDMLRQNNKAHADAVCCMA